MKTDDMERSEQRKAGRAASILLLGCLLALLPLGAAAQCGIENTAFKSGEFISYDLYFNWKFVWVKVGTASMSTVQSNYKASKPSAPASSRVVTTNWTICS